MCNLKYWVPEDEPELGSKHVGCVTQLIVNGMYICRTINKACFWDFDYTKWLLKLAYLTDIYQHLNILNTSMQRPKGNIVPSTDKFFTIFKNKSAVSEFLPRSQLFSGL